VVPRAAARNSDKIEGSYIHHHSDVRPSALSVENEVNIGCQFIFGCQLTSVTPNEEQDSQGGLLKTNVKRDIYL